MPKVQVPQELVPVDPNSKSIGRYQEGWRAGKPVEDPEKLKRWGFITAKPSEYLVYVNQGRIDMRKSGQGQRVWKWPWSSVAIVPTSLQQIDFVADQVTRERVGVSVSGVAVFRIVQPEIAFRVLNFTYGESAKEKLSQTLREMFIGAARRLIANLTLEQCLQNRKESIA
ncbi:MAG TPA: SPFH domain-containing protein, partial [Pseudomonadota bacterium]|nr:SPFH domain-containing protein [Pseudomonadota bacterium]